MSGVTANDSNASAINKVTRWVQETFSGWMNTANVTVPPRETFIGVDRGEAAVAASGLSTSNQTIALSMIKGFEREYPNADPKTLDQMIEKTIEYVQDQAEKRLMANQMELFTTAMLEQARPFEREKALLKLEDLALALQNAEEGMLNNLNENDSLALFDVAEDKMDLVCRDPAALQIAAEWGLHTTSFGFPLMAENGTGLQSSDLLNHLAREPGHNLSATKETGIGR